MAHNLLPYLEEQLTYPVFSCLLYTGSFLLASVFLLSSSKTSFSYILLLECLWKGAPTNPSSLVFINLVLLLICTSPNQQCKWNHIAPNLYHEKKKRNQKSNLIRNVSERFRLQSYLKPFKITLI